MNEAASKLSIVEDDGTSTISLDGDLDSHTSDRLASRLADLSPDRELRLNVGGLRFVDSSGLRTILAEHERRQECGHKVVLVDPSEAVARLLQITGLEDYLAQASTKPGEVGADRHPDRRPAPPE